MMRDTIRKSSNRYARRASGAMARRHTGAALRMAAAHLKASDALAHNLCPQCGGPVRQNTALTGWVLCAQFGAPAFRLDADKPACDWQGFTS